MSKGKSTVAVRRPGGEIVLIPFQVEHDAAGLSGLVKTLRGIDGDIRVVMEHPGMYWRPIALALKDAGFFVSVVNAMFIHDFSNNSLRKIKTDKADSMKIANYALHVMRGEMMHLTSLLPEFEVVMSIQGAGEVTDPP